MVNSSLKIGRPVSVSLEKRKGKTGTRYFVRFMHPVLNKRECRPAGTNKKFAEFLREQYKAALQEYCYTGILKLPDEAQEEEAQKIEAAKTGFTFDEFWERFKIKKAGRIKESTLNIYEMYFDNFKNVFPQVTRMNLVTEEMAEAYIATRISQRNLSAVTVNTEIRHLKILFKEARKLAKKKNILFSNPFEDIEPLMTIDKDPRTITYSEEQDLILAIEDNKFSDQRTKLKQKAIVMLALEAGLRNSEIRYLRWQDIDMETGEISLVCRDEWTTKNKKNRRSIVSNETLLALKELRIKGKGKDSDKPFYYWSSQTLTSTFRKVAARAKVKCTLHDLRRTALSRLTADKQSDLFITKVAGHSNAKVTKDSYIHLETQVMKDAIESAHARARKSSEAG